MQRQQEHMRQPARAARPEQRRHARPQQTTRAARSGQRGQRDQRQARPQQQRQLRPVKRKQARRPVRRSEVPKPLRQPRAREPLFVMAATMVITMGLMIALSRTVDLPVATEADDAQGDVVAQEVISTSVENVDELFVAPYNWNDLRIDDKGRYLLTYDSHVVSRTGVDVSEHQGTIDWQRVANDGVDFAIVRVGYRGTTATIAQDATFDYNLQQARAAGLGVGVYFYSLATSVEEAQEEAQFTIAALEGATLEYPIVFDLEPTSEGAERLQGLDKDRMTEIAQAFCSRIEEAGYRACVYGNQTDLSRYHLMRLAQYGFWYAQYGTQPTMSLRFALWQYTQQGEVDGIERTVDLDLDLTALLNGPLT